MCSYDNQQSWMACTNRLKYWNFHEHLLLHQHSSNTQCGVHCPFYITIMRALAIRTFRVSKLKSCQKNSIYLCWFVCAMRFWLLRIDFFLAFDFNFIQAKTTNPFHSLSAILYGPLSQPQILSHFCFTFYFSITYRIGSVQCCRMLCCAVCFNEINHISCALLLASFYRFNP